MRENGSNGERPGRAEPWRRIVVWALLPLLASPSTLWAASQERAVFPQERFTRTTGAPNVYNRTFDVPPYVSQPHLLDIINGNPDGGGGSIPGAVSSGSISVDGVQVVSPRDFSATVATIQRTLDLSTGSHGLQVRLNSAPGSYIRATISGVIHLGDLSEARSRHTATLLGNGRVLLAGGQGLSGALASTEVFDPATLTASPLSAGLVTPRAGHSATLLPGNQTLLVAGEDSAGPLTSAELVSADLGTVGVLATSVQVARSGHTATMLQDGRVLILGGVSASGDPVSETEIYDPVPDPLSGVIYDPRDGTFRTLPSALAVPRSNHTATPLPSGQILVAGGADANGRLDSAEVFDPATGHSTLLPARLSARRSAHTATLRPDGTVLIAGGSNDGGLLGSLEVYDPLAQTFSAAPGSLIVPRAGHTATLLPSGEILIAGGEGVTGILAHTELIGPPAPDATAPRVALMAPGGGAIDVDLNAIISIRFSEPVDPRTVTSGTLRLSATGAPVFGTVGIGEAGLYAFFLPEAPLQAGSVQTITLDGIQDLAGNPLSATSTTFTTVDAPVITGFDPTHGPVGIGVTITGDHFDPAGPERNLVTIGNVSAPVSAATVTRLAITVPPDAAVGPARISVQTRGGRAESAEPFVVDNPTPILTSMDPVEARAGSPGLTLTITGTHFVAGSVANFDGTPLSTAFLGATQLTAQLPATAIGTAGMFQVTVTNPPPGGGASNPLIFTVAGAARASLGDFVWNDQNANGLQDAGEPGMAGVSVRLLDAAGDHVATTTTDASGLYLFADLMPGDYAVEFLAPPGFAFSPPDRDPGDALDSDADLATGRTTLVSLSSGQSFSTLDAGLFLPPTQVQSSPMSGEVDVAVTRETILRFSNPLAFSSIVEDGNLFAEFGGRRLPARIHMAPDRQVVTLFYNQNLPPSARIRVTLIGDGLLDVFGNAVDADGDSVPGGTARIDFNTLTLTTLSDTRVCGRVFASELAPGDSNASVNVPLGGVTVTVDGLETVLRAVSDNLGNFCLDPAPVGRFFVHIDGRTAVNQVPTGDYYPFVGKLWESTAGQTVNIGDVFLPRVIAGTLQPVSRIADTVIAFPPSVLAQFPEFAGVQITVPADSLYSDDGSRGGMVGIAPVPPDRLPGPPPQGLEFPVVITVQTDGASNFDQPVPACFPNLADPGLNVPLAPGTKNALYSFNHDTGGWEHIGPMTVAADGRLICTDPGVGILAPGWHGSGPPPTSPPPTPNPRPGPPRTPPTPPPPPTPDPCPALTTKINDCAARRDIGIAACLRSANFKTAAVVAGLAIGLAAVVAACVDTAGTACAAAVAAYQKALRLAAIAQAAIVADKYSCMREKNETYEDCVRVARRDTPCP